MKQKYILTVIILAVLWSVTSSFAFASERLKVTGTHFELNGEHFEFCGVSFFNALYNPAFNESSQVRQEWLKQFQSHGVNVIRVWCQWDNKRGFIDSGPDKTMYHPDGSLRPEVLATLKSILADAGETGTVVLLALFSRESWNENIRLSDSASEKAVEKLASELKPYHNLIFQIWNEFDYRTVDYVKIIKSIDSDRLVTNSPGYAGYLGTLEENRVLDYLSPHTTRDDNRHWEMAEGEIRYLLAKFRKPVVDDEPARRGTPQFGGPKTPTFPEDKILHIYNVWKAGGYAIYHHDMFQTGYGSDAIPPYGIPAPGFSPYHDRVFEFLKNRERYLKNLR